VWGENPVSPLEPVRKVVGSVDAWQRKHRWAGVPYAVQKKFGNDNANLLVVALAWYGFTSIFPLLLVVFTVFTQIGAASLGTGILNTLKEFPIVGSQFNVGTDSKLHSSIFGLVVGLVGLLYGAQGVTQSAQQAMAVVWNVPQIERTGFLPRLGRSLAALLTIGFTFLANAALTTYLNGVSANLVIYIPVIVGLLILNSLLYFATFYLLTAKVIGPRGLLPGAVLGGVVFTALITVGTGLVTHDLKNSSNSYGTFATVIGIVLFLLLLAKLSLYAAELNPVLSRKLYPRALPLVKDPTEADRLVLSEAIYAQQRTKDQVIGVGYGEDGPEEAAADALRRGGRDEADADGIRQGRHRQAPDPGNGADQDGQGDRGRVPSQSGTSRLGRLRRLVR
jgi:uncharacterized BrkB/YihY/UPF0761 family membrane protein